MKNKEKEHVEIDILLFLKLFIKEIRVILLIFLIPFCISAYIITNDNNKYSISAEISKRDLISMEEYRSFNALIDTYYYNPRFDFGTRQKENYYNPRFDFGTKQKENVLKKVDNESFFKYFKYFLYKLTSESNRVKNLISKSNKELTKFNEIFEKTSQKEIKDSEKILIKSLNIKDKNEWFDFIYSIEQQAIESFRIEIKNSFEISRQIERENNKYLLNNLKIDIESIETELKNKTLKYENIEDKNDKDFFYLENLRVELFKLKSKEKNILYQNEYLDYIGDRLFKSPIFSEDFYLIKLDKLNISLDQRKSFKQIIIMFALSILIILIYLILKYNNRFK